MRSSRLQPKRARWDCRRSARIHRALQRRLKKAQLRHSDACFEDINLNRPRGLDRSVVLGLGDCPGCC